MHIVCDVQKGCKDMAKYTKNIVTTINGVAYKTALTVVTGGLSDADKDMYVVSRCAIAYQDRKRLKKMIPPAIDTFIAPVLGSRSSMTKDEQTYATLIANGFTPAQAKRVVENPILFKQLKDMLEDEGGVEVE